MASQPHPAAVILVEGEGRPVESTWRAFISASVTLTLGILGSSVLPVPFAFSRTGVLLGLLVSAMVSMANSLTGTLLLRAAGYLGEHTFESLADRAAGRGWKVVTQVSLVMLLFGTLCGDYALLADLGKRAIHGLFRESTPGWLIAGDGRVPMVALGLFVVFPLSCLKRIRQLEYAAMAGVGLVFILAGVIVHSAVAAGFPAIRSGELPLGEITFTADVPEAVAVLSFAFYVQPMLLPLLKEMPTGRVGVNLTCRATQLVTIVVASVVYGVVGVFAAARYGLKTEGDVLVNAWLPGRWDGALDGLVAVYLSLSMVPMVMTLRYQLDSLVAGYDAPYFFRRELFLTVFSLLTSLAVALAWPTAAEKMFAVTGASAVCLVCYVIPVAIHLGLYFGGKRRRQRLNSFSFQLGGGAGALGEADATTWLLLNPHPSGGGGEATWCGSHLGGGLCVDVSTDAFLAGHEGEGEGDEASPGARPQPPFAAGAASPTLAAPVPVKGLHHTRLTDISLDNWLQHSRSKDGSFADSAVYGDSLPYSPLSPGRRSMDSSGRRSADFAVAAAHQQHQQQHQHQVPQQHQYQFGWQPEGLPAMSPTAIALGGAPFVPEVASWQRPQLGVAAGGSGGLPPLPGPPGAGWARRHDAGGLEEPLLHASLSDGLLDKPHHLGLRGGAEWYPSVRELVGKPKWVQAALLVRQVGLPVFVMLVGSAFSLGALWLSVAALVQ